MMEDETVYSLLFAVILLHIVYQQASPLEYTDTAESCKEQAQLTAAVTRLEEEGCGMTLLRLTCSMQIDLQISL